MKNIFSLDIPKKIFILVALIATIVPALFVLDKAGGIDQWKGVLPQGVTDSVYYYARIHEVVDGHPLIGNPYIYEYRSTYAPAFFIPDVLSALPLLIGLPFSLAVLLNVFAWSFVFLMLAHTLLTLLRVEKYWAIGWSLFLYLNAYAFMLRPTVMQIIFPLFLFFLITLIQFLYEPFSKKRTLWLAGTAATTFYFYNYLAFVVFLVFALVFFWFLIAKQYKELRALVVTGLYTAVLLIPFGVYSLIQMKSALYAETLMRIGLVHTHIPSAEAFFFGRWIVIGLVVYAFLWFFFPKTDPKYTEQKIFWVVTGGALLVGLFLNVITGTELTLGVHIGRFVVLWSTLLLGVFVHEWYFSRSSKSKMVTLSAHALIGVLVLLLSIGTVRNIPRALAFFEFDNRGYKIAEQQAYSGPLAWLENTVPEESVVWSNMSIGNYIPIMTKHYVLFHNGATLHAISEKELEERYLLWRSLDTVTVDTVKRDFELYAGSGASTDQPRVENSRAWLCAKVSKFVDVGSCPQKTNGLTMRGEQYFERLAQQSAAVRKNQKNLLAKYHVDYVLIDTLHDTFTVPMATSTAVYADGRFFIFRTADIP